MLKLMDREILTILHSKYVGEAVGQTSLYAALSKNCKPSTSFLNKSSTCQGFFFVFSVADIWPYSQ